MKHVLTLSLLAAVSVALSIVYDQRNKRRVRRYLQGRPPLTHEQFGQSYYSPDKAAIAAQMREILSRHLAVDISAAIPADRFLLDLKMDALDSMSTVEFILELEEKFAIKIQDEEAQQLVTLDDVIQCVADKLRGCMESH